MLVHKRKVGLLVVYFERRTWGVCEIQMESQNEFTELEMRGWRVGRFESLTGLRGREGRCVIPHEVCYDWKSRGEGGVAHANQCCKRNDRLHGPNCMNQHQ